MLVVRMVKGSHGLVSVQCRPQFTTWSRVCILARIELNSFVTKTLGKDRGVCVVCSMSLLCSQGYFFQDTILLLNVNGDDPCLFVMN